MNSNISIPSTLGPLDPPAPSTTHGSPKKDIPSKTSEIVTLEPFEQTSRKRKRLTYRPDPTLNHFDSIFGIDNWARFLTLKSESKIASSMLENKLLNECPTQELGFRLKGSNEWLVETTTKKQSEAILKIKEVGGVKVEIIRHDTLNYIQGTVVLPHIQDEEIPEKKILLESLKLRYNNIHDLEVFQIKSRKNPQIGLNIMKIKFIGQTVPQKIKILGQNREVRPYVPKPLQCNKCCRYGHTHKKCTNKEVCTMCGSNQHKTNWNCDKKLCLNCGENHHAKDKTCVFYIYNTELKLLMSRTGMSAKEAKLELKVRGVSDPARNPSYKAAVVKSFQNVEETTKTNQDKNEEIETKLEEMFGSVETENRFNVLEENETSTELVEVEDKNLEENRKRTLERTPPRSKKANSESSDQSNLSTRSKSKEKKVNKNVEVSEKSVNMSEDNSQSPINGEPISSQASSLQHIKDQDELSPSPIIGNPNPRRVPSFEKEGNHDDMCGCHECFVNMCKREKNTNKESWKHMIDNFTKNKKIEPTKLETHKKGCMCVDHLTHYKERNTQFLEKFVERKVAASYGRLNARNASSINHGNLTTLT